MSAIINTTPARINAVHSYIIQNFDNDPRIFLLKDIDVIRWIFGDTSFLPVVEDSRNRTNDNKKRKVHEDAWGKGKLRVRRPDLNLNKQWTNKWGEHIVEEIYALMGENGTKPIKINRNHPDLEINDFIIEAKAQTFFTSGTAGEKILGTPFKYCEVPKLYKKPLKIVCVGGAEKVCRQEYGNLPGPRQSMTKHEFLKFFKENGIEYVAATDLLMKTANVTTEVPEADQEEIDDESEDESEDD
jgi:hypothetical protein